MIRVDRVTFTHDGVVEPALVDVDLSVPEGELCLVVGPTGSGKSTLLRCINGLVPWFSGGRLAGEVQVAGRATSDHPPRELADVVGMVGQAPSAGFVTDVVEDELAYTMENLGVPVRAMRQRVEEIIDLLGLQDVRDRPLAGLSSGQQQRVAIGSVLTASPRVLLLDEPTSALDPGAAEEVLAAVTRLVHDLGLTVLMAEHRLERVVQYADRVAVLEDGRLAHGLPAEMMQASPVAPPVVELGRLAGWDPLPLSVRDARRRATELVDRLNPAETGTGGAAPTATSGGEAIRCSGLVAHYGDSPALLGAGFAARRGEVLALMGRNGAGKSTLLAHLAGLRSAEAGTVVVDGHDPAGLSARELVRHVGLVPADPGDLLYGSTVGEECAGVDHDTGLPAGTTAASVRALVGDIDPEQHPRDLSEGQRLAVALGVVLATRPPVVLLDEPTRGLDYAAKRQLAGVLRALAADGHTVVLATHDVELVAEVAHRVVVLADGEVVADGPAREVITDSPMFAPQVAKILNPGGWLTVDEVRRSMVA